MKLEAAENRASNAELEVRILKYLWQRSPISSKAATLMYRRQLNFVFDHFRVNARVGSRSKLEARIVKCKQNVASVFLRMN